MKVIIQNLKEDFSILQKTGHFNFALTGKISPEE